MRTHLKMKMITIMMTTIMRGMTMNKILVTALTNVISMTVMTVPSNVIIGKCHTPGLGRI